MLVWFHCSFSRRNREDNKCRIFGRLDRRPVGLISKVEALDLPASECMDVLKFQKCFCKIYFHGTALSGKFSSSHTAEPRLNMPPDCIRRGEIGNTRSGDINN